MLLNNRESSETREPIQPVHLSVGETTANRRRTDGEKAIYDRWDFSIKNQKYRNCKAREKKMRCSCFQQWNLQKYFNVSKICFTISSLQYFHWHPRTVSVILPEKRRLAENSWRKIVGKLVRKKRMSITREKK